MPRIAVPEGADPLMHVWTGAAPGLSIPAAQFSAAVYEKSALPLREFEAARIRIAQINNCQQCLGWRSARDAPARASEAGDIDEEFYAHVGDASWQGFTERETLAVEFAERFALDHLSMDDPFWARLRSAFSDSEIVDLGLCVGMWISQGRLNQILDVDGACRVPAPDGPLTGG
ncbi:MAG: carboxymuconolactone decarboxylase family protein [Actinomycetes bacterium]